MHIEIAKIKKFLEYDIQKYIKKNDCKTLGGIYYESNTLDENDWFNIIYVNNIL